MKILSTLGFVLFFSQVALGAPMNDPESNGDYTRAAAPNTDISQDSFFTVYLDVNPNCKGVYNRLIHQLEKCRDGVNHGDPSIKTGCFLDFNLNEGDCGPTSEEENNSVSRTSNSVIYFPAVTETPWHPTPPCDGKYCTERGPAWSGGSSVNFQDGSQGYDNISTEPSINDGQVLIRKPVTQPSTQVTTESGKVRTQRPQRENIIKNLLQLIQDKNN